MQACSDAKLDIKEQFESLQDNISDQVDGVVANIKNTLLSTEMQEAIDAIEFVLEKLKQFDMEAKQYDGYGFILLALLKKAQIQRERNLNQQPSLANLSEVQLKTVQRFGHIAVRMYPLSWSRSRESVATKLGVSPDCIIKIHFSDDEDLGHCPKFLLYIDHDTRNLVLAIRGTFSVKDAVLDAVAEEEEFLGGRAHKGILSGARIILSQVVDPIKTFLAAHPDYSLVVTGHSLGAGTAELITMELMITGALTNVHCIALAPPPVYRSDQGLPEHVMSVIDIYINNYDCVPRLSLASVARMLASIRAVDSLGYSLTDQLRILLDSAMDNEELVKISEAVTRIKQDQFPDLEHPGNVYHIQSQGVGGDKHTIYLSKSRIFTQSILLLDNMITDHLHTTYESILSQV